MTKKTIIPTRVKLIRMPPGPASRSAFPEPTSRPGPMIPFYHFLLFSEHVRFFVAVTVVVVVVMAVEGMHVTDLL